MPDVNSLIEEALKSKDKKALALAYSLVKNPALYISDPVGYCRNVLGVKLWHKQEEILSALVEHKRVLVKSANSIGKSFTVACAASWFHDCFKPGICSITAPTNRQVNDITFKEIRRLYKGTGLYPKLPRIQKTPDHYVHGFTATDASGYQGIHGENLFVVFEECTGVDSEFWEAANSILIGGQNTYFLAVCNPTDATSQAYIEEQSGRWHTITVSAFEHPNIAAELAGMKAPIPGAIRLEQLREAIKEWCTPVEGLLQPTDFIFEGVQWRPGPIADARLLGRYPTQGAYSIFTEADFDKAKQPLENDGTTEIEIGVDVARFGDDDTTIHVKQGSLSLYHERYNGRDTTYTAQRIKSLADKYAINPKKTPIRVDSTGVGGGLCDQKGDYNFIEINASHKAHHELLYPNKRSELLFVLADKMRKGELSLSRLPKEVFHNLRQQALGITYKLDDKGRRVAEKKADIKKRIGRSPDDLDALALAYCGTSPLLNIHEVFDGYLATALSPKDYMKEIETNRKANESTTIIVKDTAMKGDDMGEVLDIYKEVHFLRSFGSYQARVFHNKVFIPLQDYLNQHMSAYSAEHAHKLLGTKCLHTVRGDKLKDEQRQQVQQDVEKTLKARKLWSATPPVKKKEKEEKSK